MFSVAKKPKGVALTNIQRALFSDIFHFAMAVIEDGGTKAIVLLSHILIKNFTNEITNNGQHTTPYST